jgi:hypothetical protein
VRAGAGVVAPDPGWRSHGRARRLRAHATARIDPLPGRASARPFVLHTTKGLIDHGPMLAAPEGLPQHMHLQRVPSRVIAFFVAFSIRSGRITGRVRRFDHGCGVPSSGFVLHVWFARHDCQSRAVSGVRATGACRRRIGCWTPRQTVCSDVLVPSFRAGDISVGLIGRLRFDASRDRQSTREVRLFCATGQVCQVWQVCVREEACCSRCRSRGGRLLRRTAMWLGTRILYTLRAA